MKRALKTGAAWSTHQFKSIWKRIDVVFSAFKDPLVIVSVVMGFPLAYIIHITYLKYHVQFPDSPFVEILVEAHGLIFDIIFFSVILAIFSNLIERRRQIKRYKEELDDYRGWDEGEAAYRVAGIIRRLKKEKVKNICFNRLNLSQCSREIVEAAGKAKVHIISLQDAILEKVDLRNANLKEAKLQRVIFKKALLQEADLAGAELQGAFLKQAKLIGTILREAKLQGASLRRAELQGADLQRAQLQDADISDTDLQGADLRGADLKNSHLWGANLQGADLRGACLKSAVLHKAKLKEVKVNEKDWIEKLEEWNVKLGLDYVKARFYVDKTPQKGKYDDNYYVIKEKQYKEE